MKLLPVQSAAAVLGVVSAIVVVSTVVLGTALLPGWANFALVAAAVVLILWMVVQLRGVPLRADGLKGLFRLLREALPKWAIALAALAFYGGWLVALITAIGGDTAGNLKHENGQYTTTQRKKVTVLTEEQYVAAQAANQRVWSAISLAMAGGVVAFAGVGQRIRETRSS